MRDEEGRQKIWKLMEEVRKTAEEYGFCYSCQGGFDLVTEEINLNLEEPEIKVDVYRNWAGS